MLEGGTLQSLMGFLNLSSHQANRQTNPKSNRNFILGITDTEIIRLDFGDTPFDEVKYWALRVMK
jgi:hypothetical protein